MDSGKSFKKDGGILAREQKIMITILNWEKFCPRRDLKSTTWFRLSNRLLETAEFGKFTPGEIVTWIYILSQASIKQSATVEIDLEWFYQIRKIRPIDSMEAIQKLQELQCVHMDVTPMLRARDVDAPLHNVTNVTNVTNEHPDRLAREDFEIAYARYPRKEGKQKGLEKCKVQIKTQEEFQKLLEAIENYKRKLAKDGTEPKFVKHFDTFMSSWRDWLDSDAGNFKLSPVPNAQALALAAEKERKRAEEEQIEFADPERVREIIAKAMNNSGGAA